MVMMMEDSEAQRRIELQAPDDLSYLLANVRRAAAARLDEAFPPVDGADAAAGDDELRTRIEKLVDEVWHLFILFSFSFSSVSILMRDLTMQKLSCISSTIFSEWIDRVPFLLPWYSWNIPVQRVWLQEI